MGALFSQSQRCSNSSSKTASDVSSQDSSESGKDDKMFIGSKTQVESQKEMPEIKIVDTDESSPGLNECDTVKEGTVQSLLATHSSKTIVDELTEVGENGEWNNEISSDLKNLVNDCKDKVEPVTFATQFRSFSETPSHETIPPYDTNVTNIEDQCKEDKNSTETKASDFIDQSKVESDMANKVTTALHVTQLAIESNETLSHLEEQLACPMEEHDIQNDAVDVSISDKQPHEVEPFDDSHCRKGLFDNADNVDVPASYKVHAKVPQNTEIKPTLDDLSSNVAAQVESVNQSDISLLENMNLEENYTCDFLPVGTEKVTSNSTATDNLKCQENKRNDYPIQQDEEGLSDFKMRIETPLNTDEDTLLGEIACINTTNKELHEVSEDHDDIQTKDNFASSKEFGSNDQHDFNHFNTTALGHEQELLCNQLDESLSIETNSKITSGLVIQAIPCSFDFTEEPNNSTFDKYDAPNTQVNEDYGNLANYEYLNNVLSASKENAFLNQVVELDPDIPAMSVYNEDTDILSDRTKQTNIGTPASTNFDESNAESEPIDVLFKPKFASELTYENDVVLPEVHSFEEILEVTTDPISNVINESDEGKLFTYQPITKNPVINYKNGDKELKKEDDKDLMKKIDKKEQKDDEEDADKVEEDKNDEEAKDEEEKEYSVEELNEYNDKKINEELKNEEEEEIEKGIEKKLLDNVSTTETSGNITLSDVNLFTLCSEPQVTVDGFSNSLVDPLASSKKVKFTNLSEYSSQDAVVGAVAVKHIEETDTYEISSTLQPISKIKLSTEEEFCTHNQISSELSEMGHMNSATEKDKINFLLLASELLETKTDTSDPGFNASQPVEKVAGVDLDSDLATHFSPVDKSLYDHESTSHSDASNVFQSDNLQFNDVNASTSDNDSNFASTLKEDSIPSDLPNYAFSLHSKTEHQQIQ